MAEKQKFYVVWSGRKPGIYTSWEECKAQVSGAKDALYKSYSSRSLAEKALAEGFPSPYNALKDEGCEQPSVAFCPKDLNALVVDAACSGNPGPLEYRGVDLKSGAVLFHVDSLWGTNNIGEFLAIIHALAWMEQQNLSMPVYSDSRNALLWVVQKRCSTQLVRDSRSRAVFALVARAERWLTTHEVSVPIRKWPTKTWGEIPADFGRK